MPAAQVDRIVDLTGAGDLYAAGFLYGLSRGFPHEVCGRLGSLAAAEVICTCRRAADRTRSGSSPARRVLRPEPSDILPGLASRARRCRGSRAPARATGCAARRCPECCRDRARSRAGTGCAARRSRSRRAPTAAPRGRARGSRRCRRRPACWPGTAKARGGANPIAAISARRGAQRAARGKPVAARGGADALLVLPCEPLRRQPVRARHVDERPLVLRHVGQEIEGLHRRMERVDVEVGLRVGLRVAHVAQDRLHVGQRLLVERADIAVEAAPVADWRAAP